MEDCAVQEKSKKMEEKGCKSEEAGGCSDKSLEKERFKGSEK